jgi:threonine dehydrogenase-like Zn-dependent dehydrogenase
MRAVAVFPKAQEVKIIDRPYPAPLTGSQVLLRVLEVGLCDIDREICAFHYGSPPPGEDFLILGHEALAEVVERGPAVRVLQKGQLVVPTVRRPCSQARCAPCRAHRQDYCLSGEFSDRGIKHAHGFLQEYVVEDEEYLVPVHRKLAEVAVLAEAMTVATNAVEQSETIQRLRPWEPLRVRALVLGMDPAGLLGVLSLVLSHHETFVYAAEPPAGARARVVESLGATYIPGQKVPLREVANEYGPMDLIYESMGDAAVAVEAFHALRPNGLVFFSRTPASGEPLPTDVQFLMRNIVLHNQHLLGSLNSGRGVYEAALRALEQGMFLYPDGVRAFIGGRHPMETTPSLVAKKVGIKQVIRLSEAKP